MKTRPQINGQLFQRWFRFYCYGENDEFTVAECDSLAAFLDKPRDTDARAAVLAYRDEQAVLEQAEAVSR